MTNQQELQKTITWTTAGQTQDVASGSNPLVNVSKFYVYFV